MAAVIRYYRLEGWTKVAVMNNTDATGQDGDRAFDEVVARPENKDMRKVEQRAFQSDRSQRRGADRAHQGVRRAGHHRVGNRDTGRDRRSRA